MSEIFTNWWGGSSTPKEQIDEEEDNGEISQDSLDPDLVVANAKEPAKGTLEKEKEIKESKIKQTTVS